MLEKPFRGHKGHNGSSLILRGVAILPPCCHDHVLSPLMSITFDLHHIEPCLRALLALLLTTILDSYTFYLRVYLENNLYRHTRRCTVNGYIVNDKSKGYSRQVSYMHLIGAESDR